MDFEKLLLYEPSPETSLSVEQLLSPSLTYEYSPLFVSTQVFCYKLGALQAAFLVLGTAVLIWRWRKLRPALRFRERGQSPGRGHLLLLHPPDVALVLGKPAHAQPGSVPWRFLAFLALPCALLAGVLVESLPATPRAISVVALTALAVFSATAGLSPTLYHVKEADLTPAGNMALASFYLQEPSAPSAGGEYLPKWVKNRPATSPGTLAIVTRQNDAPVLAAAFPGIDASLNQKRSNYASYKLSSPGRRHHRPQHPLLPRLARASLTPLPSNSESTDPSSTPHQAGRPSRRTFPQAGVRRNQTPPPRRPLSSRLPPSSWLSSTLTPTAIPLFIRLRRGQAFPHPLRVRLQRLCARTACKLHQVRHDPPHRPVATGPTAPRYNYA